MGTMSFRPFSTVGGALPFGGMVVTILIQAINMVVCKIAISHGLNKYIYVVYCNAISSLILFPCSFIFHRSSQRPPLTFGILLGFFALAIIGGSAQIFGYAGIQYSSPTLASALLNLIPGFTFILAVIFRMEKVDWRSRSSQAKIVGTIVSIGGAFVATFYKGPAIMDTNTHSLTNSISFLSLFSAQSNWILGGFFITAEAFNSGAWYILQVVIVKKYPAVLVIQFYQNFFAAILCAIYSLTVVKDLSAWRLRLDVGLVAVLYSSIAAFTIRLSLLTWCVGKTGPLYVSTFKPLVIIFVVLMSITFLGDVLSLGSLIGAVIIVIGFYSVMWGKAKEKLETDKVIINGVLQSSVTSSTKVPLLQDKTERV